MSRRQSPPSLKLLAGSCSRRALRSAVGILAIGAPAALGLAACSSTSSSSTTTSSTPTTTKAPSGTDTASALARDAGNLCSEVSTAVRDSHHLKLSSPSSLSTSSATINRDLQHLQATLHSVSAAGEKSSSPLEAMVTKARAAVKESHLVVTELAKGNLGTAHTDFNAVVKDVRASKADGAKANIRACI